MSYNRNFRQTVSQPGRYNNSGQFVSAGELGQSNLGTPTRSTRSSAAAASATPDYASLYPTGANPPSSQTNTPVALATHQFENKTPQVQPPQQQQQAQPPQPQQTFGAAAAAAAVEPKQEQMDVEGTETGEGERRHSWMKGKGIKKISNKERRRRQNEHLRRLLTPKNALMVLNEMMPGEQLNNNFTVEPAPPASTPYFRQDPGHKFCAGLSVEGNVYKGFGENKLTARNQAAEQAIRDLVIKRMTKVITGTPSTAATAAAADQNGDAGTATGEEDTEPLPMIQLASYALHKLFSEWQYEGFQVPLLQLQRTTANATTTIDTDVLLPTTPKPKKVKELPADAATLHPCMLLTIMRQGLVYHELGSEGDRPQNMLFTMGVTVDGTTYIGKASNKKEARKQAARSACQAIFNVQFADTATATAAQ